MQNTKNRKSTKSTKNINWVPAICTKKLKDQKSELKKLTFTPAFSTLYLFYNFAF